MESFRVKIILINLLHKQLFKRLSPMPKQYIPFFTFLALLLFFLFPFDFATSVVPGWHTTIFPPHFFLWLVIIIFLFLSTIGYWFLAKRVGKINWMSFFVHLVLNIPSLIFIKFPSFFLDLEVLYVFDLSKTLLIKSILLVLILFMIGQALFVIHFVRNINSRK
jgi:hypothetical protein